LSIPIKEIAGVSGLSLMEPEYITTPTPGQVIKLKVRSVDNNYFLKLGLLTEYPLLVAEQTGLDALKSAQAVKIPEVVFIGTTSTHSLLITEYLELKANNFLSGKRLGEQLAALHRHTNEFFGLGEDNWIGLNPQMNNWSANWTDFFIKYRLSPQCLMASRKGSQSIIEKKVNLLMESMELFFTQYKPQPSLLHGDLWSGNWGTINEETPVIFDPAVYYGDREADLAMSKLFGGFPNIFYEAYNHSWPLDSGFNLRQNLYNLYHLLNHLNLFGEAYLNQTNAVLDQLLSEI
jgi:fructosamine-3-kinase|tara:strand:+ start:852 stop:1724 length:873 start_codon:yes stop_codon:yes gene_type:complete